MDKGEYYTQDEKRLACNLIRSMRASSRKSYITKTICILIDEFNLCAATKVVFNRKTKHINFSHALRTKERRAKWSEIYPTTNNRRKCINKAGLDAYRKYKQYKENIQKIVFGTSLGGNMSLREVWGYNPLLGSLTFASWFVNINGRPPHIIKACLQQD